VLASLDSPDETLEIPFPKGGEAFWLDDRTVAHVVDDEDKKRLNIYAIRIHFTPGESGLKVLSAPDTPTLIATLPTSSATNFRYRTTSEYLVFSDSVYADGDIWTVNASLNYL
jgi:hypothetical protein